MKRIALFCLAALAAPPRSVPPVRTPARATRDSARYALDRLAYGPRPGEIERVAAMGVMAWIDRQLDPDRIPDPAVAARERKTALLGYDRRELVQMYVAAMNARRERQRANQGATDAPQAQDAPGPLELQGRRLALQYQTLAVVRAAESERQLYEIMVDFWTNHFNVFFGKGADRFLLPDYIEHTIRPHAMGRFADLLIATAQSPAMLFYLDNWESVAPGAVPPNRRRPALVDREPKGINENYARELLELHTVGVDAGYTQHDVINAARILTGWSPRQGGGFAFRPWAHDRGEKVVMGVRYPAGRDGDEGVQLLQWLARQPATMHRVSRKLCQRFVADDPPDGCVDDAVAAWRRTDGDMREVLRAIFHGPDFWVGSTASSKVKTPLEFVASALRAVAAVPDSTPRLAQVVARLGEPLYMHVAPDGYPETDAAWVNSGALLDRMNVAVALAANRLPGAAVDLDVVVPAGADPARIVRAVDSVALGGAMTDHTRRVIEAQIADVPDPVAARAFAVGLALGGPEFQRR